MQIKRSFIVTSCSVALMFATAASAFADQKEFHVSVTSKTGKPVPVTINLGQLRDGVGSDFAANWDSLRVLDVVGKELPFQVDDVDMNGELSRPDELSFLSKGNAKIVVNDEEDADKASYPSLFTVAKDENGILQFQTTDGQMGGEITGAGVLNITKFNGMARTYVKDLGLLRYAGFPQSTYWSHKKLGQHAEKTTYEEPLRIVKSKVLADSPVRLTVVTEYASDAFPGLRSKLIVSVYPTGDALVRQTVNFAAYTDLTKLMNIVNGVLSDEKDARHLMPVNRYLDWADELGITPAQYWEKQGVLTRVDGQEYAAFADKVGPKPLFWGASYIFAGPERWRTNFSPSGKVGVAEFVLNLSDIPADLAGKLKAVHWHLEGEWRTGYFRWVAGEVVGNRQQNNIPVDLNPDMAAGDWPLHAVPGDQVEFQNLYSVYQADDEPSAVRFLEARYAEITGVSWK